MSIETPSNMRFKIIVSDADFCQEFHPEIEPNRNFLSVLTLARKNDLLKNYNLVKSTKVSKSISTFMNQEIKSANNIYEKSTEEEYNGVTLNQKRLVIINQKKESASCACIIF